jgi:hypothetical protein
MVQTFKHSAFVFPARDGGWKDDLPAFGLLEEGKRAFDVLVAYRRNRHVYGQCFPHFLQAFLPTHSIKGPIQPTGNLLWIGSHSLPYWSHSTMS